MLTGAASGAHAGGVRESTAVLDSLSRACGEVGLDDFDSNDFQMQVEDGGDAWGVRTRASQPRLSATACPHAARPLGDLGTWQSRPLTNAEIQAMRVG